MKHMVLILTLLALVSAIAGAEIDLIGTWECRFYALIATLFGVDFDEFGIELMEDLPPPARFRFTDGLLFVSREEGELRLLWEPYETEHGYAIRLAGPDEGDERTAEMYFSEISANSLLIYYGTRADKGGNYMIGIMTRVR